GNGTHTVTVPFAENINYIFFDTRGGNDTLIVDYSGGDFGRRISYNAGTTAETAGDALRLIGRPDQNLNYLHGNLLTGGGAGVLDSSINQVERVTFGEVDLPLESSSYAGVGLFSPG